MSISIQRRQASHSKKPDITLPSRAITDVARCIVQDVNGARFESDVQADISCMAAPTRIMANASKVLVQRGVLTLYHARLSKQAM